MLHEKTISFRFKGDRTYIPGVDIFDSLLEIIRQYTGEYPISIQGSFHRLLRHNAIFRIYETNQPVNFKTCHAHFSVQTATETYQITVSKIDEPITSSYVYDEEQVTKEIIFHGQAAEILIKPEYSYIEQLVAITKKLHIKIYPEAKGQWLFTKIQLTHAADPKFFFGRRLVVKAVKNLHYLLTQNSILLDDVPVGEIWFSLARKEEK